MIKKLQYIWLALSIVTVCMLIFSGIVYSLLLKNTVEVPLPLSIAMAFYVIIIGWNSIYVQFLNGVGKIRLQLISGIFGLIITIPLAIYFGKQFGIAGIVLSSCILGLINTSWTYLQVKRILANKATGVWAK